MSLVEFEMPEFLKDKTARSIEEKMLSGLPDDIDKVEGGLVWDLTMPTALEKAELIQYQLMRTCKIMFFMWADGRWLDYHAYANGLERRAANKAYGYVTVTGRAGVAFPAGFVFSVPSDSGEPAIDFEVLEDVSIPEEGTVRFPVQAVVAGKSSNVAKDTITIMRDPVDGVTSIHNEEPITGGAEAESDESLRQRIDDVRAGRNSSFVGNNADYKRWAMEVPGVGFAHTIPEYHGPNSVKVVVVDADGLPANEQILKNVYVHIFGTERKDLARFAPVGVIDFAVVAPEPVNVDYSFHLKLADGATEESVIEAFRTALSNYYAEVANTADRYEVMDPLKYVQVSAVLVRVKGVDDFKHLRINGKIGNVVFQEDEFPVTGNIEVELYE